MTMGLKKAENQVKILLADTILALCRSTLNFHAEICVEGLIGVTLDKEEIFLVNINQSFKNPDTPAKTNDSSNRKRSLVSQRSDSDSSSSESSSEDTSDNDSSHLNKPKRKRKRNKKKKRDEEIGGDEDVPSNKDHSDIDNEGDSKEIPETCDSEVISVNEDSGLLAVKQEVEEGEEDDEELVFVKEEMADLPESDSQFSNISHTYHQPLYSEFSRHLHSQHHQPMFSSPLANSSVSSNAQLSMPHSMLMPGPSNLSNPQTSGDRRVRVISENRTCGLCGKVLASRSHLRIHMRVHTGEKPFICDICGRGCVQRSDLKKHKRTVHKIF